MQVVDVRVHPFDVPLSAPFGIASGSQPSARNVLVEVELDDATVGLGEAAPFPAANGETREAALAALGEAPALLVGTDPRRLARVAHLLGEAGFPASARCALETALLDAITRRLGLSAWHWFGGSEPALFTDVTIVTGSVEEAASAAERWTALGFTELKVKVGGAPFEHDAARLRAVARAAPRASLLVDANASLEAAEAIALLGALGEQRSRVRLVEQPCGRTDLAGLRAVREAGYRVVADESAVEASDLQALLAERAADVVNLKVTKQGVLGAVALGHAARAAGLGLMIGGMVETELCMTVSACLAAGLGGFEAVDLDTPLFLRGSPFTGGFSQRGPELRVDGIAAGLGVRFGGVTASAW